MNIFIIAIIGIVAFLVMFFALFPPQNDGSLIPQVIIKPEHYDIEITGLKETYLVGEPYSFSYILYGFGDPCGGIHITFPINKTDSSGTGSIPSCLKTIQTDFVLDMKKTYGTTYGHIALQEAGNYTVKITFEKGSNGPTITTKSFLVVDNVSTGYDTLSESDYDPHSPRCSSGVVPYIPENWQTTGRHPSDETWETLGRHLMAQEFYKELQNRNIVFEPACFGVYTGGAEQSYPARYSMCSIVTASNGTQLYLEGTIREFNVDYFHIDNQIPYQCDDDHDGCLCGIENEN